MRPSVTKSRRRHFVSLLSLHSFFFFFFFYLSLRSFFSHSTIRARLLVLCVQTAALRLGAAAFGHILSSLFLYMTPNAHNTPSVCLFVLALPFSSPIFFKISPRHPPCFRPPFAPYRRTAFFFFSPWDFSCVCISLFRRVLLLLLCQRASCSSYTMYVFVRMKRRTIEAKYNDEKQREKRQRREQCFYGAGSYDC